jgi:hypothetical protein
VEQTYFITVICNCCISGTGIVGTVSKQEVLERTNLPALHYLKKSFALKPAFAPT